MEFLRTVTQYSHFGYPIIVFYLVALIGFVLVIFRPYRALLFSIFCLAARNFHAAVFTRTQFFGPYVNLNDLLLWIALFAMLREWLEKKRRMWAPPILLAIFGLIIIGDVQSIFKYSFEEPVLRRIWCTAIFPLMFLISANMVNDTKRAHTFYWTLFFGNVIAAMSHMYYIHYRTSFEIYVGIAQIRTISYLMSGGAALLIGSLFAPSDIKLGRIKKFLFYIGLILIALSFILSFTRSFWVSMALAIILLPFLIRRKASFSWTGFKFGTLLAGGIILSLIIFPTLELDKMITERFQSFIYKETFSKSYESRWRGSQTEIDIWLDSTLVFGKGSCLPFEFEQGDKYQTGALYHVAYSAYLAHYGLIGLIIYLILLPILTIKAGKSYYLEHARDYGGKMVLIGIACSIMYAVAFLTSMHYLGPTTHIPGMLIGSVWGLYRSRNYQNSII